MKNKLFAIALLSLPILSGCYEVPKTLPKLPPEKFDQLYQAQGSVTKPPKFYFCEGIRCPKNTLLNAKRLTTKRSSHA